MTAKVIFLGLLLICVAAGAEEKSPHERRPSCLDMPEILACPMNLAPVCGNDGNTYANECTLCAQSRKIKMDIYVVKDESC
ncbi:serine peptidase inhibitor, Kazal type 4 [Amphiprion ocellaris]|uniref:Kazal-like domain-containing protein n=2 Tax=Amphiprion TaxID=80969 RepID=A0A3Q1BLN5_AMPOC|nr:serine peptidase inhibitor, Kazal type 4 [Amphiprion ocellaris]